VSHTAIDLKQFALHYSSLGLSVIPLHSVIGGKCSCGSPACGKPGKHPRIRWRSLQGKPLTEDQISEIWQQYPESNIGVITGSMSGIAVLDIDGPEGIASLEACGVSLTDLPATPTVMTGGGGLHLYFRMPHDPSQIKTSAGVLPKVDIRADGGLVVMPPSMHVSGRRYEWQSNSGLDLDFADFDFTMVTEPESKPVADSKQKWYEKLLAGVSSGGRNEAATRLAGRYLGLGMSETEVFSLLKGWNSYNDPPLPLDELRRTVRSISQADKGDPSSDFLQMVSDVLRIKLNRVRRITGDDPKVILEFDEGTTMLTTSQLLSPRAFQQSIAEATKVVIRKLGAKSVPTHDRLAQMILSASEDVDAGDEATGLGELMMMVSDFVMSHSVLPQVEEGEVPHRGPFVHKGRIWISVTDMIQRAGIKWGTRPSLGSTVQLMRAAGMVREAFSVSGGSTKTMWGLEAARVPFAHISDPRTDMQDSEIDYASN